MARVLRDGSKDVADKFDPDLLNNISFSGTFKGTLGYMAPEQIGEAGDIGTKTDIYSLGSLLYFILTKQAPVESDSKKGLIEKTKNFIGSGILIPTPIQIQKAKKGPRFPRLMSPTRKWAHSS